LPFVLLYSSEDISQHLKNAKSSLKVLCEILDQGKEIAVTESTGHMRFSVAYSRNLAIWDFQCLVAEALA
jgi:hypothetical protein